MKILRRNDAQGALEYLMTYGWAIIVIMSIGATLWYLGLFGSQDSGTPTGSGFSKIRPLEQSIIMSTECVFSGIFVNGGGSSIEITGIEVYNSGDEQTCTPGTGEGTYEAGKDIRVMQSSCCSQNHVAGESYALIVKINYTEVVAGALVGRVDVGKFYGHYVSAVQLETCEEQTGHGCCISPYNACQPGKALPASCSPCCQDLSDCITVVTTTTTTSPSTTTTTTPVTTTTTSAPTTTTTLLPETISGAIICGSIYECGISDNICPQDFSEYSCDNPDPDC